MDTHLSKRPTRRRIGGKSKLLGGALVALAAAAIAAPAASAVELHGTQTFDEFDQFNADNPCGYVIPVENAGTIHESAWYDPATNMFTRDVYQVVGAITFSNPANGKSVTGTYDRMERATLDGSGGGYIAYEGLRLNLLVPGEGAVLVRAGRLVVHIDDVNDDNSPVEVVFEQTGTGGELFQVLCPALA
jgi:hypothetical protein